MSVVLIKRGFGDVHTHTYIHRMLCEDKDRDGAVLLQAKEHQRLSRSPEAWTDMGTLLSLISQNELTLPTASSLTSGLRYFVMGAQAN